MKQENEQLVENEIPLLHFPNTHRGADILFPKCCQIKLDLVETETADATAAHYAKFSF